MPFFRLFSNTLAPSQLSRNASACEASSCSTPSFSSSSSCSSSSSSSSSRPQRRRSQATVLGGPHRPGTKSGVRATKFLMIFMAVAHAPVAAGAGADDDSFSTADMLQAAVLEGSKGLEVTGAGISDKCLGDSAHQDFKRHFQSSVDKMLEKSKRSMQHGLAGVADATITLLEAASSGCGKPPVFEKFRGQAQRLRVMATSRSLGRLDSKVKYEPLKSLTVGDIDIHKELNGLLVAWQLKKGSLVVGQALAAFLQEFADDTDAAPGITQDTLPKHTTPMPGKVEDTGRSSPTYWVDALNEAFFHMGDNTKPVAKDCISIEMAQRQKDLMAAAFDTMMQKTRRGMQQGLRTVAGDLLKLLDEVTGRCEALSRSPAVPKIRSAASRLEILAASKSLIKPGGEVSYDPMKALKVGGVDIHAELNRLIGSWIANQTPLNFGKYLAQFLQDFKEEDETEEEFDFPPPTHVEGAGADTKRTPMQKMISGAIAAAGGIDDIKLEAACFSDAATGVFVKNLNAAIDHMLQKRRKTMQQGLKEMATAVDQLLGSEHPLCIESDGAKKLWRGAKKLRTATRRTVVDYGTHIKYEALKSLSVGDVPIHKELNGFLTAWKLRGQEEAGRPFGELMAALSTVSGYDEL
mmetsp:Transcript_8068/g.18037  ORF Transcript_8068/g.18037 Transcript_8068/m.18037 type:complete len:635 (-) Transcript_8068:68-1972(-)